jgi:hypothetical protein
MSFMSVEFCHNSSFQATRQPENSVQIASFAPSKRRRNGRLALSLETLSVVN